MDEILRPLYGLRELSRETLVHVFDILLVAYLNYRLLSLTRGSRAWRILGGIVAFVLLLFVSSWLELTALHWILDKATLLAPVALVILLLPELRQALEGVSKLGFWPKGLAGLELKTEERTVEAIVSAATELSAARLGALIVLEREAPLEEVIASGIRLNAQVGSELLGAVFYDQNPLHDGAAIIRGDVLVAAACRLPLSDNPKLAQNLHMRHRAAIGITEQADSLAIVVSEERGTISLCQDGDLRRVSPAELREALDEALRGIPRPGGPIRPRTLGTRLRPRTEDKAEKPLV